MSVTATVLLDVMDLSGVFCVADSGVLQDAILWNSMGMHTCSVWFSNTGSLDFDEPTPQPTSQPTPQPKKLAPATMEGRQDGSMEYPCKCA